jgi:hypothetical protein
MYFTDSPSREIVAFDYDQEAGQVKPHTRRVFATVPEPGVRGVGGPVLVLVDGDGKSRPG